MDDPHFSRHEDRLLSWIAGGVFTIIVCGGLWLAFMGNERKYAVAANDELSVPPIAQTSGQ